MSASLLLQYQQQWGLQALAEPLVTASGRVQHVQLSDGRTAMLKVTKDEAEQRGGRQLLGWQGCDQVVPVYAHADEALLLAFAPSSWSLLQRWQQDAGCDDDATQVLATTLNQVHQMALAPAGDTLPLAQWLADLWTTSLPMPLLGPIRRLADRLLSTPQSCVGLHGDGHHGNVLCFEPGHWRVIDPKGLQGEHYFDYVPILTNPDLGAWGVQPERFERQLARVCAQQDLDPQRLRQWVAVGAALSAVWFLEDGLQAQGQRQLLLAAMALESAQMGDVMGHHHDKKGQ
ncbi:MAG: hypothetical protein KA214_10785 [Neisseriaceae bacterium]|nr:hypothetical protein [Neisseriaceae bacterium]